MHTSVSDQGRQIVDAALNATCEGEVQELAVARRRLRVDRTQVGLLANHHAAGLERRRDAAHGDDRLVQVDQQPARVCDVDARGTKLGLAVGELPGFLDLICAEVQAERVGAHGGRPAGDVREAAAELDEPCPALAPRVWAITATTDLGALLPLALFDGLRFFQPRGIVLWATTIN